jgi:glycerol kinase
VAVADYVGAIDQGTTSTRFVVFDRAGSEVARHQLEHTQVLPRAGWVEHDPVEIWEHTRAVIEQVLSHKRLRAEKLAGVGVTNQRETTVVWSRHTGQPYHNAIVWQDTRTDSLVSALERDGRGQVVRERAGLVAATYFSAGKLQWLLEHVAGLAEAAEAGEALFGTIDTWLLWNLTGGVEGGVHLTDVTNASRTMLMNVDTLDWDDELLALFGVPRAMLPEIRPSSDPRGYGATRPDGPFRAGVLIGGALGDQQAAMLGQACFDAGMAKNTYGTGNFLLLNTGTQAVWSHSGLLTTPAYQLGRQAPVYALEGSIAVTGSAVQWLRDQLGLIHDAAETETLASSVDGTHGVYFVPAFSGLFAPDWRADARGAIVGLSRFHTRAHLVRATLEAICFQSRDVAETMATDAAMGFDVLRVDGGATANATLLQLQADILGVAVSLPRVAETTALGAAYAAGLATGLWASTDDLRANWQEARRWEPTWSVDRREAAYADWRKAVERTLNWVEV